MFVSKVVRQIPVLSSAARVIGIKFPERPKWTVTIPDAPVIETEIDKLGSLKKVTHVY